MLPSHQDLLNSFDILPESDQRIVAIEILRRAAQWETSPLSDEELVACADHLFYELDQREAGDGDAGPK